MKNLKILSCLIFVIMSCNFKNQTNSISILKYECKEIGWTFDYSSDMEIQTSDQIAAIEGKGKEAMEKTINDKVEMKNKNLIWLKKDQFNSFTSTIQAYDSVSDGNFSETQSALFQIIIDTYKNQGMQVDSKIGETNIDGLKFKTLETIIYSPDKKKVILYQTMYDGLIKKDLSLTLSINYNNDNDKASFERIIKTSKIKRE